MPVLHAIADFFRTLYRVSFKPQEVYRELASDPARRRQGWTLAVLTVALVVVGMRLGVGMRLSVDYLSDERDWGYFPPFTSFVGYYPLYFTVPSLVAGFLTLIWIALRVFPRPSAAWPALGLSLSPGFLVGGASFLLWLLFINLRSLWIQPLLFLILGAFNPALFALAFPSTYASEFQQGVGREDRLAEMGQEFWYWIPFLVIMAVLALWQGWLIYKAARELGDNQQPYLAGLVLLYILVINLPLALIGARSAYRDIIWRF